MSEDLFGFKEPKQKSINFNVGKARQGRDVGMKMAEAHANAVEDGWVVQATLIFEKFMKDHRTFMTEDVRAYAHNEQGLPLPPDGRAWGGVINRMAKSGRIVRVGYAPMKSKNCHCNPKSVWRVV